MDIMKFLYHKIIVAYAKTFSGYWLLLEGDEKQSVHHRGAKFEVIQATVWLES